MGNHTEQVVYALFNGPRAYKFNLFQVLNLTFDPSFKANFSEYTSRPYISLFIVLGFPNVKTSCRKVWPMKLLQL